MAQYTNTSLERGMSILNTLGDAEESMTLTEVASRVGLARSTCFRLMAVLQDLGFVLKIPDTSAYSLGFNAYRLGQTTHAVEAIVRDARPFLVKLTQQTGLTSYLGALEEPQLLICDFADGEGTCVHTHAYRCPCGGGGEIPENVEALSVPMISSFERPILALATIGKVPKDGSVRFQRRIDAMRAAINGLYEFRVFGR